MKKLGLLRLFACLPLIALIIPNITEALMNPNYHVPVLHIIAGAALVAVIGICTVIITYLEKQELKVQYQRNKH
jgi:ABC-type enterochelin transport system permease subunit